MCRNIHFFLVHCSRDVSSNKSHQAALKSSIGTLACDDDGFYKGASILDLVNCLNLQPQWRPSFLNAVL